jgi:putative acetyltransferase
MLIRFERPDDATAVHSVNRRAFGQPGEAELVDALRTSGGSPFISLVAEAEGRIVGHILFTPVTVEGDEPFQALGLAPMAVLPEFQRRGIGSQLVRAGLDACRDAGESIVFVVGHPEFYPRFGFMPAQPLGLRWDRVVPTDVFMVCELMPDALRGRRGIVRYRPEFDRV